MFSATLVVIATLTSIVNAVRPPKYTSSAGRHQVGVVAAVDVEVDSARKIGRCVGLFGQIVERNRVDLVKGRSTAIGRTDRDRVRGL